MSEIEKAEWSIVLSNIRTDDGKLRGPTLIEARRVRDRALASGAGDVVSAVDEFLAKVDPDEMARAEAEAAS